MHSQSTIAAAVLHQKKLTISFAISDLEFALIINTHFLFVIYVNSTANTHGYNLPDIVLTHRFFPTVLDTIVQSQHIYFIISL